MLNSFWNQNTKPVFQVCISSNTRRWLIPIAQGKIPEATRKSSAYFSCFLVHIASRPQLSFAMEKGTYDVRLPALQKPDSHWRAR